MIDSLVAWDWSAFECINQHWTNGFFDLIMPFMRQAYFWIPVYLFIFAYSILMLGRRAVPFLIAFVFVFFYSDLIAASLIKPLVERIRPCNASEQVRLLVNCGGGYSFPSAHATNHFGISFFLYFALRQYLPSYMKFLIILWALVVSYAQVYVGVHFPLDVLAGGLIGVIIARFVSWYLVRTDFDILRL